MMRGEIRIDEKVLVVHVFDVLLYQWKAGI
jgi:hypothetical protein